MDAFRFQMSLCLGVFSEWVLSFHSIWVLPQTGTPSSPASQKGTGIASLPQVLSHHLSRSGKLSAFQGCGFCVQMSEIHLQLLRSSEETLRRQQRKTCSRFVFKAKEGEKEKEKRCPPWMHCPDAPLRSQAPQMLGVLLQLAYSCLAH